MSRLMSEVPKLFIHKANTTAYNPQTDGLVEQFNCTLSESWQCYLRQWRRNSKNWDQLSYVLFAYQMADGRVTFPLTIIKARACLYFELCCMV